MLKFPPFLAFNFDFPVPFPLPRFSSRPYGKPCGMALFKGFSDFTLSCLRPLFRRTDATCFVVSFEAARAVVLLYLSATVKFAEAFLSSAFRTHVTIVC